CGAIFTGGGNALAVGEVRNAGHAGGVAYVLAQLLAALRVPDAHAAAPVGDNALAVGRERGARGSAVFGVRLFGDLDLLQHLAGLHVPDEHRAAETRRQHALAIRRQRRAVDPIRVSLEETQTFAGV